ncbi:hypothetical protein ERJ75_000887000 [Trypanosoma vivax]|nr:hypothetical protein ERJ75_000887000 [Trypanosoma vivax]
MVRGPGFLLDRVRDPGTTMRCPMSPGKHWFFFFIVLLICSCCARLAAGPRLCRPAGGVERNPDPILASSRGTLKQIALDGESASRTCFRMPLAVRTPIRFGATEGGVGGIQSVGERCLFTARAGLDSGSSGVGADVLSSLKSSFKKLAS